MEAEHSGPNSPGHRRDRRRGVGVRVQISLIATVIVGAALVVGAAMLTGLLYSRLGDTATAAATLRARDVAGLAAGGRLPSTLALPGEDSAAVQVLSADGTVIAASENIEGRPPIANRRPVEDEDAEVNDDVEFDDYEQLTMSAEDVLDDDGQMRVVLLRTDTPEGPVTVIAAESLEDARETVASIAIALALTIPVMLALVVLVTWWAVGRTLRPVRSITATLAEITATDLHRRVPAAGTSDEIGKLADTVNETLARLDTAVERQRRFVADASHELRGPLAALRGDLEVSVNHPEQTDWTVVANDTLSDVDRLQHLTEDLLTLARLGAVSEVAIQPVDLVALADDELKHVDADTIAVTLVDPLTPMVVSGSTTQLRRVLRNLIDNAVHHAATSVTIEFAQGAEFVEVRIVDDGPGIPEQDRARVLEPFVRLDAARTRDTGGTGLGLAIVDEIVRSHDGIISLTDTTPHGLTATVRLPCKQIPGGVRGE